MLPIQNLQQRTQEFFTYSTGRLDALTAGATINTSIVIQADSDFVVEKLTMVTDLAGAAYTVSTAPIPNATVLLTASGSGQQLMNTPFALGALFGNGQLPFILPYPRVLRANSQLQIQIVNFDAAVATARITLCFHGRKVYNLATGVPLGVAPRR